MSFKLHFSFFFLLAHSCICLSQTNFEVKLEKLGLDVVLPSELYAEAMRGGQDQFASYDAIINPDDCDCELRYIINEKYVPGLFLPPHAEMIRLLGSLGSNTTNSILVEQHPELSGKWSAYAHFAPKEQITSYPYASMRTYYQDDGPLLHTIIFYNEKSDEVDTWLESLKPNQ